jgi:bifunctional non-homologous end joining protein LigD
VTGPVIRDGAITVELSHPDKVLFPAAGAAPGGAAQGAVTKGDLVEYYLAVAGRMLPLVAQRPVTMIRYPDGITAHPILQKNAPDYFPDWITRAEVPKQGGSVHHVIIDRPATLAYLANQACVEVHVFGSRVGALDHPDQLIFDLDPPDDDQFAGVVRAARLLRELLESDLGLTAYVKTTGGKGLHVHVPLDAAADFDAVRDLAKHAGEVLAGRAPDLVSTEQRKDKRRGLIYADPMRNAYGQHAAAPYSVRGRPGAPAATPLDWAELDDQALSPHRFTVATVPGRLAGDDPWAGMPRRRYSARRAAERLSRLAS